MFKLKSILSMLIAVALLSTTVAYSALNTTLNVKGSANVRAPSAIRVVDIKLNNSNNSTEINTPKYTKNTISTSMELLDNTSNITYTVTIKNSSNEDMMITSINELTNNNQITYNMTNYKLYDLIEANSTKEITITYQGIGKKESTLEFNFTKYSYNITYNAQDGVFNNNSNINNLKVHFDGEKNIITYGTIYAPIKENAIFINWYSDKDYKNLFDISKPITSDIEVYAKYRDIDLNFNSNVVSYSKLNDNTTLKDFVPIELLAKNSLGEVLDNIKVKISYNVEVDEVINLKIINNNSTKVVPITLVKDNDNITINIDNLNVLEDSIFTISTEANNINNYNGKVSGFYFEKVN